ncbi:MAG TPA: TIGR03960 family B12-binding radical SAM protein, partial [Acidimicrobiales bacterium]|nr:TIGR03960 family B12-binding radical SAM protein [Acidimicrobiales bacterium]
MTLWPRIEPLLARVDKPARYIGCEEGCQQPAHGPGRLSWLLVYPDTYEIGLPNQGLQILYEVLNERPDALAERAYAPWVDMEAEMRRAGVPLFSVDSHRAAADFDVIAFNLSAELVYTNVLNCLDLAGVPVRAADRPDDSPLVGAGGHCAFNPEPLADFVDFFVIGDGEEAVGEVTSVLAGWKRAGKGPGSRHRVLRELAQLEGVYVPAMYEVAYDGPRVAEVRPRYPDVPERVSKRTVSDLAAWPYPKRQLVPLTEVVHDRLNVEVFRGCTRGCRFCQAGMITRPVRERPASQVRQMVLDGLARTGYSDVSLTSLSSADYSGIEETVAQVIGDPACTGQVAVSLPSLRVDAFTVGIASEIQKVRRTGLTFAPEAGTWRMRRVINKLISEDDLFGAVEAAFSQGWQRIKLYFLVGLPTETDEDVEGIAELCRRCVEIGRAHHHRPTVTASVGGFVPKAHTPFQWFGQATVADLEAKVSLLKAATRQVRGLSLRWHDPRASLAEGIASRGDRRLGPVIEEVWRRGGTFQEWSEHFDLGLWERAMASAGLSVEDLVHRHRSLEEVLPWDHISAGLHKDFLWQDWQEALAAS